MTVNRRSAMHRMLGALGAVAAASLPLAQRASHAASTTTRDALGWLVVIGQRGETIIRISPRFAWEYPRETLEILRTGTFR
jgi:hypothetical protein